MRNAATYLADHWAELEEEFGALTPIQQSLLSIQLYQMSSAVAAVRGRSRAQSLHSMRFAFNCGGRQIDRWQIDREAPERCRLRVALSAVIRDECLPPANCP